MVRERTHVRALHPKHRKRKPDLFDGIVNVGMTTLKLTERNMQRVSLQNIISSNLNSAYANSFV